MKKGLNFCIGAYWNEDIKESIGCYMLHGSEVFYSDLESAKNTLEYVKKQSPDKHWRIFEVKEYEEL